MGIKKIIIKYLIDLREEKILPLSKKTGINRGNLSQWLKDAKGGYVSKEKVHTLSKVLGFDEHDGKLSSGIHRFYLNHKNIDKLIFLLESLLSQGGEILIVSNVYFQDSEGGEFSKKYCIFFPREAGETRIIGELSLEGEEDLLRKLTKWTQQPGSSWSFKQKKLKINLEDLFKTPGFVGQILEVTESVSELDEAFGFKKGKLGLSWETLLTAMKRSGKSPEDFAQILNLDPSIKDET